MDPRIVEKAKRVRMIIMDVDGVLTSGQIVYGGGGLELLAFDVKDGFGIVAAHRGGLLTALVTGRTSEAVARRAKELGITEIRQGCLDKLKAYEEVLAQYSLPDEAVAYIGDDLPDLPILARVGLKVAVANASEEVKVKADYVTVEEGGRGAVREAIELILRAQGLWDKIQGVGFGV